ncbi:RNA-binding protein 33 isoform X1 [Scleropages formosus]|uniref:RNA binding motif protein 33 n=1 Tax=Scleropages formosus TaxID=113540 RepID=A0A8C9TTL5_SCLFO|nr:RNA-binding protein 33 isoform X1 [Scleropages formosus]
MAACGRDDEFDEYDKPGAERSRRRRGDEDFDSDLEGDLLEEDWLSARKNPSEGSEEELNDDLLQSDEEDQNMSGPGVVVSLDATGGLDSTFDLQEQGLEDVDYVVDDVHGLGAEGYEEGDSVEGYPHESYEDAYGADGSELPEDQLEYGGEQPEGEVYQDEVLDIDINDPIDDDFQVDEYVTDDGRQQLQGLEDEQDEPDGEEVPAGSQMLETEEMENKAEPEEDENVKEESDEEEDDDEESGRLRFKTERKNSTVVRLSDAAGKRRNIPETLELSEEAKADLLEFEEKERQRKQGFGGRSRGRGARGTRGGGRGRFLSFGLGDFRGEGKGRMNEQRMALPISIPMSVQLPTRMRPHHNHQLHPHHHPHQQTPPPRGPFQDHGPTRQPPQPLIPPHLSHRAATPPMDTGRMLSPPPPPRSPQQQPKNIHINPHFRGPSSSPVQVPLMPAQNPPRPTVVPQRFPGPADFQQHIPRNFTPPQRPHHPEPWGAPLLPQEREPFFISEPRFPGQHMFDQQSPAPLMSHGHALPGQGVMGFNQPGGGGLQQQPMPQQQQHQPPPIFQREPPRPGPPLQGPLGQHGPPAPRQPFAPPRQQQFPQQGPPFAPQHMHFGMQVWQRGMMHLPPHGQPQHHEPLQHQQQHPHQRQDLPSPLPQSQLQAPQHHAPHHLGELRPLGHTQLQPPFRQPPHGVQPPLRHHPQPPPRAQRPSMRSGLIKPRMNSPSPNVIKPPIQQVQALQRNSNLRELPVAPTSVSTVGPQHSAKPEPKSEPPPIASRPPEKPMVQKAKPETPAAPPALKAEPEDPEEDEETRLYRLKIEEQKRLREEILKRKELRRQLQAGMRKKELLERITAQQQQAQQAQAPQPTAAQLHTSQPQPQQAPSANGAVQAVPPGGPAPAATPRPNVKARLLLNKPPVQCWPSTPQHNIRPQQQQGPGISPQQARGPMRQGPQFQNPQNLSKAYSSLAPVPSQQQQPQGGREVPGVVAQLRPHELKPGVKRTVMQRANSGGREGLQVPQKVRVVKLLGGGGEANADVGPPLQQQHQHRVRPPPQLRQVPVRKVTVGPAALPQLQPHQQNLQQLTPHIGRGSAGAPLQNRGRGRGASGGAQVGRGRARPMAVRQTARPPENQLCGVSIEGLSSSTTDVQLKNLLMSIGPIQMFKMLPHQRKAIAKFINPQHAYSFQQSFHRHMIDLSHIDVSLIDG